jgi:hypothetical protein
MNALYDENILKNIPLAAEVFWNSTTECFLENDKKEGLPFRAVFLVLPILFHKTSSEILSHLERVAPLETLLQDHPEILNDLQQRMVRFSDTTLTALNICFISNVLRLDTEKDELFPGSETPIVAEKIKPIPLIVSASKNLGQIFSGFSVQELCDLLHIKFEK